MSKGAGTFLPIQAVEWPFYAFHIGGGVVLLPILVIVMFAQRNVYSRNPVFLNFFLSWSALSFMFMLLLFSGEATNPRPRKDICNLQAIGLPAVQVWAASAATSIVVDLWFRVRRYTFLDQRWKSPKTGHIITVFLLSYPFVVAIAYTIGFLVGYGPFPSNVVRRTSLYCTVNDRKAQLAVSGYCGLVDLIAIIIHIDTGRTLYRQEMAMQTSTDIVRGWVVKSLFVRMALFVAFGLAALVSALIAVTQSNGQEIRRLTQAFLPLAAFFIFGSNPAVWKRDPPSKE